MPLINLTSNLKDNKFGHDRVHGGSSNQPYIKTPIPEKLGEFGYLNQDFILRGGSKAVTDSALDVVRLGKYFTDIRNPSGLLFVVKQNLLSRMAVRTQSSGRILNEGIYTPLSTLVEAGGVAFGLHVNKQGLNPFGGIGGINTYSDTIRLAKDESVFDSHDRLSVLYGYKILNDESTLSFLNGIKVNSGEVNVLSYQGGPGSILGIGNTNIKFADQRTGLNNPNYGKNSKYQAEKRNIEANYNNALGLSISSSFSGSLNSTLYSGINNQGQIVSLHANNQLINNVVVGGDVRAYQSIFALSKTNRTGIRDSINLPLGASKLYNFLYPEAITLLTPDDNIIYKVSADPHYQTKIQTTGSSSTGFLGSSKIEKDVKLPIGVSTTNYGNLILSKQAIKSSKNIKGEGSNYYYALKAPANTKVNFVTYTENQIKQAQPVTIPGGKIIDFRQNLKLNNLIQSDKLLVPSSQIDYSGEKKLETRTKLGEPGNKTGKNLTSYTNGSNPGQVFGYSGGNASNDSYDIINALPIYSDTTPDDKNGNDLVKFRIGVIDNDQPDKKTYIHFRAFLNQISDGYTADWSGTKYIGRGENFYTYNGFDRKVSLSWTVAAQSKAELIPMYKKLNYLASICAPDYSINGYMRGNLVTLTIGGYFYEQPGIITGFNYEMNEDNSTWEIGLNDSGGSDNNVKELPHVIKVSGFNFIPIHTFVPRKQLVEYNPDGNVLTDKNKYGPERYIALSNGDNNNYGPVALHTVPKPISPPDPNPAPTYTQNFPNLLAVSTFNVTPVSNGQGGTPTVIVDKTYDWNIGNNKVYIDPNGKEITNP
jgi:hypothetical protein